jgi:uncharacterized membrane protein
MMNKKWTGVVAYLSWIGLVLAFVLGDRTGAKVHLNQALVLNLAGLVMNLLAWILPILSILTWVVFILWVMALVGAILEQEKKVPLLGEIVILK